MNPAFPDDSGSRGACLYLMPRGTYPVISGGALRVPDPSRAGVRIRLPDGVPQDADHAFVLSAARSGVDREGTLPHFAPSWNEVIRRLARMINPASGGPAAHPFTRPSGRSRQVHRPSSLKLSLQSR